MQSNNKGASIVICCYNSAFRLPETIRHIAFQQVSPDLLWELIIVNNNSTDNTEEIADNEINKYPVLSNRYQLVGEPQPGLSHARNRGVEIAKYELIIFCDDDNWLDRNYLQTAFSILNDNKNIAAVGGQSEAVSNVKFPDWWEDYKLGYAVGKQGETTGNISKRKYLWGSGLCFRKSLFLKAFEKYASFLSDRRGNELSSGGDSEICLRFLLMGYQLYYDERLTFKHYIPSERLSWEYRKRLYKGFEDSSNIINVYVLYVTYLNSNIKQKLNELLKNLIKLIAAYIFNRKKFYTPIVANSIYFMINLPTTKTSPLCKQVKEMKLIYDKK